MEYLFLVLLIMYAGWTLVERNRHFERMHRYRHGRGDPSLEEMVPEPVLRLADFLPFYLLKLLADGSIEPGHYRRLVLRKPQQLVRLLQNHGLLPETFNDAYRTSLEAELMDRHLFSQATVVEVLYEAGLLADDQLHQIQEMAPEAVQTRLIELDLLPSHLASLDLLTLQEMMLKQ